MEEKYDEIVVIGRGLLGSEIKNQIIGNGSTPTILSKINPDQKDILPRNTKSVIFVAQSHDYRSKVMTQDLAWVNTLLPFHIIAEAHKIGVKKFIYCSTGSVYDQSTQPHEEDELLSMKNLTPYVATKKAAENLILSYEKEFDCLAIMRPFFIYGPNQFQDMLIPKMFAAIKSGQAIQLAQNKGLIFNPIHVYDAAKFILKILADWNGTGIFNIAGKEVTSLKNIVSLISSIIDKSPNFDITTNLASTIVGSTKKMESIGFNHEIELNQGLAELYLKSSKSR